MRKIPDINFVKKEQALIKLHSKRMYLIQSISLIVLAVYTLILLSLISYSGILGFRLKVIQKKIATETEILEKLTPIETQYVVLKRKASAIYAMTSTLYRHQDLIEEIFKLLPSNLSINGFSVDKNNEVKFSAASPNPLAINEFIANVNQHNAINPNKRLEMAIIEGLNVNDEGVYSFTVSLKVNFNDKNS